MRRSPTIIALFAAACAAGNAPPPAPGPADAGPPPPEDPYDHPGASASVTVFDRTLVSFTGAENRREVTAEAAFPPDGAYKTITLHLALDCPDGGCDAWDRFGSLAIVPADAPDTRLEVARFITPYGVKAAWDLDVTALRPLLSGRVRFAVFIDTWVGPGSPYGGGWSVTARFELTGGLPERTPLFVLPVFPRSNVVYGDPARSIPSQLPAKELSLMAGASSWEVRAIVTGHGQGNADNCAEFCPKTHHIKLGQADHTLRLWRDDCDTTAVPNQRGNWRPPRTGWCPGADVKPWVVDVSADLASGASAIAYDVEAFENSCRAGVSVCRGCTLGTGCEYDGGAHTEPYWSVSALLVGYR